MTVLPWQVVCPFVRPSVCSPSLISMPVTLRYRGHIGWNYCKIISGLTNLFFLLFADPNVTDILYRKHLQILAVTGLKYGKIGCGRTKPEISPKRLKIERKLLLMAYINRLYKFVHGLSIAKCMTLNDLWARFKVIDSLNATKGWDTA